MITEPVKLCQRGVALTLVILNTAYIILCNPGVTHSVPTAFMMNAVGTEWVPPGLPRMGIHLQMKTTCYMREVSIKLANCNRNFATWPFSHQKKMRKHYGAVKVQNNIF